MTSGSWPSYQLVPSGFCPSTIRMCCFVSLPEQVIPSRQETFSSACRLFNALDKSHLDPNGNLFFCIPWISQPGKVASGTPQISEHPETPQLRRAISSPLDPRGARRLSASARPRPRSQRRDFEAAEIPAFHARSGASGFEVSKGPKGSRRPKKKSKGRIREVSKWINPPPLWSGVWREKPTGFCN